jgi:hypothetical protein
VALAAVGGGVTLVVRHQRKRRTLRARLGRFSLGLRRMVHNPERVAKPEPDLGRKVLATAATTLTGLLIRRVGQQVMSKREKTA